MTLARVITDDEPGTIIIGVGATKQQSAPFFQDKQKNNAPLLFRPDDGRDDEFAAATEAGFDEGALAAAETVELLLLGGTTEDADLDSASLRTFVTKEKLYFIQVWINENGKN